MPIEYEIDRGRGLVFRKFLGNVTLAELARHYREQLTDPEAADMMVWVTDERESLLDVRGDDVRKLVRETIEPLMQGRYWHCAAVVGTATQYGVTNQFAVYSADCGETKIFYDVKEAIEWATAIAADGHGSQEPQQKRSTSM